MPGWAWWAFGAWVVVSVVAGPVVGRAFRDRPPPARTRD